MLTERHPTLPAADNAPKGDSASGGSVCENGPLTFTGQTESMIC